MNSFMQRSVLYQQIPYIPPSWLLHYINPLNQNTGKGENNFLIPKYRYNLGQLPTPIHSLKYIDYTSISHESNNEESISNDNQKLIKNCLENYNFYMKRDDITSFDMSGNKLRKLEFLLSHIKNEGYNSIITIGGIQSNHCRATALAAKQLGLKCYLILRTKENIETIENDLTGNLLFNRLIDADIYIVTPSTYAQIGSVALTEQLKKQLIEDNQNEIFKPNPYIIPVGGSNEIGLFGYLDCVHEILSASSMTSDNINSTQNDILFDHIVFACGSGGTATGLGLGFRLHALHQKYLNQQYQNFLTSNLQQSTSTSNNNYLQNEYKSPEVHAMYVCDHPEYFYKHIEQICHNIGILTSSPTSDTSNSTLVSSTVTTPVTLNATDSTSDSADDCVTYVGDPRKWLHMHYGVGIGYARSTDEELDFIIQFSCITGILLDPVYSGKAMYYFMKNICNDITNKNGLKAYNNNNNNNNNNSKPNILFIHTGGVFGLYDKSAQLLPLINGITRNEGGKTITSIESINTNNKDNRRKSFKIGKIFKMKVEKPLSSS